MPEPSIAVLVPNLFLRIPVETAIRGAGAVPEGLRDEAAAARSSASVVVVDLDGLGDRAEAAVQAMVAAGKTVLATGPHVEARMLSACRAAGAVVLPRSAFLQRLPELLALALRSSE